MVKCVLRKIEFNYKNEISHIEARYISNRILGTIQVSWSKFCGKIARNKMIIQERYKYYTPLKMQRVIEQEKIETQKREKQVELTREEKRQQCKCKQKCKSEFECGLF